MRRRWAGVLAFLVVIGSTALTAVAAQAATVTCGQVITQSIVLEADVGPCPGEGLVVGASDITIDLGGHTVFGAPSTGVGIRIEGTGAPIGPNQRVRIRNGTVTGFRTGVLITRSADNVFERLVVRDNSCHGIQLHGTAASGPAPALRILVRENVIRRNGCSAINLLQRAQESVIERNVMTENGLGVFFEDFGLINSSRFITVRQNSIFGNRGPGVRETGIGNTIAGNSIRANGGDGVLLAFHPFSDRAVVQGNQVLGNALNGVAVDSQRRGNTVTANVALGNGSAGGFDLADRNFQCTGNTWTGNTFVTRNQPCIS